MKPQEVVSLDMFKYIQQELALNFAITLTHCHITVVGQEIFGCVNNSPHYISHDEEILLQNTLFYKSRSYTGPNPQI